MSLHGGILFFVLMAFQVLIQTTITDCKPAPDPKPGFFGSVVGGAAGSVIGKMISDRKNEKHHHHYYQTTIERRETFANGCYKQVVKEPDAYSPGRWTESEQLICPPNVAPPASVPGIMPQQFQTMPGVPPQQQVYLLSTKTYFDRRNSGNNLLQHSFAAMLALALLVYFV